MNNTNLTAQDYMDAIIKSAEIIGNNQAIPKFDKTIIGQIIAIDKDRDGWYRVKADNISFDAQAQYDYEYSIGEQVYITIIQGDYSGEKRIVGKAEKENKSFYKTDPFQDFITKSVIEFSNFSQKIIGNNENGTLISLGQDFFTTSNKYIGLEFSLDTHQVNRPIQYNKNIRLEFSLIDQNGEGEYIQVGNTFVITENEVPGNLYRAHRNFRFKVVKDLKPIFTDKGEVRKFSHILVKLLSSTPFEEGDTFLGYLHTVYLGGNVSDEPSDIIKVQLSLDAPPEEGEEDERVWSPSIQTEIGKDNKGKEITDTQQIYLQLTWDHLDFVNKKRVQIIPELFSTEEGVYSALEDITITWQKRTERQGEWEVFKGPYRITSEQAYESNDEYIIKTKPIKNEKDEIIGYDYFDDTLPGSFIEYRAVLSSNNLISDPIAKFENLFKPNTSNGEPPPAINEEEIKDIVSDQIKEEVAEQITPKVEQINNQITDLMEDTRNLQDTAAALETNLTNQVDAFNGLVNDLKPLSTYPVSQVLDAPVDNNNNFDTGKADQSCIYYYSYKNSDNTDIYCYYFYHNDEWKQVQDYDPGNLINPDINKKFSNTAFIEKLDEDLIYQVLSNKYNHYCYWYYNQSSSEGNSWKETKDPKVAGVVSYTGMVSNANEHGAVLGALVGYNGQDGAGALAGTVSEATKTHARVSSLAVFESEDEKIDAAAGMIAYADKDRATVQNIAEYINGNTNAIAGLQVETNELGANFALLAKNVSGELEIIKKYNESSKTLNTDKLYYRSNSAIIDLETSVEWWTYDNGWSAIENETFEEFATSDRGKKYIKTPDDKSIVYSLEGTTTYFYRKPQENITSTSIGLKNIEIKDPSIDGEPLKEALIIEKEDNGVETETIEYSYSEVWEYTTDPSVAGLTASIAGIQAFANDQGAEISMLASYIDPDGENSLAGLSARVSDVEATTSTNAAKLNCYINVLVATNQTLDDFSAKADNYDTAKIYYNNTNEATALDLYYYSNTEWKSIQITIDNDTGLVSPTSGTITDILPEKTGSENYPAIYWIGKPISKYLYYEKEEDQDISTLKATANPSTAGIAGGYSGLVNSVSDSGSTASLIVGDIGKNGKVNTASIVANVNESGSEIMLNANKILFTASNSIDPNVIYRTDEEQKFFPNDAYNQTVGIYKLSEGLLTNDKTYTISMCISAPEEVDNIVLKAADLGEPAYVKFTKNWTGEKFILTYTFAGASPMNTAIEVGYEGETTGLVITIHWFQIEEGESSTANSVVLSNYGSSSMNWQMLPTKCIWWNNNTSKEDPLMRLDDTGLMVKGTIFADKGKIGGWTLSETSLTYYAGEESTDSNNNKFYSKSFGLQVPTTGTYAISVGKLSPTGGWKNGNFRVTHEGKLYAKNAVINGALSSNISGTMTYQEESFSFIENLGFNMKDGFITKITNTSTNAISFMGIGMNSNQCAGIVLGVYDPSQSTPFNDAFIRIEAPYIDDKSSMLIQAGGITLEATDIGTLAGNWQIPYNNDFVSLSEVLEAVFG